MASNRPPRTIRPTQKLGEDNVGDLQLPSHRSFVRAAQDPTDPASNFSLTTPEPEPSTQGLVPDFAKQGHGNANKCRATSTPDRPSSEYDNDSSSPNTVDHNSESQETEGRVSQQKKKKSTKKSKKKKTVEVVGMCLVNSQVQALTRSE